MARRRMWTFGYMFDTLALEGHVAYSVNSSRLWKEYWMKSVCLSLSWLSVRSLKPVSMGLLLDPGKVMVIFFCLGLRTYCLK